MHVYLQVRLCWPDHAYTAVNKSSVVQVCLFVSLAASDDDCATIDMFEQGVVPRRKLNTMCTSPHLPSLTHTHGWLATAVQGLTCHTVTRDLGNVLHSHETSTALLHATVRIDGTQQPDMSTQYVALVSCAGAPRKPLTVLLGGCATSGYPSRSRYELQPPEHWCKQEWHSHCQHACSQPPAHMV